MLSKVRVCLEVFVAAVPDGLLDHEVHVGDCSFLPFLLQIPSLMLGPPLSS
jgi:hypothetical protein